jgi:hypothetical protein
MKRYLRNNGISKYTAAADGLWHTRFTKILFIHLDFCSSMVFAEIYVTFMM